jgi:hypothetical protein
MTNAKERKNMYSFHLGLPFLSYPGSISNINSVQGDGGEINIGCYETPSKDLKDNYTPRNTRQKKPTNTAPPEQNKTEQKKKTPTPRKKAVSRKPAYKVDHQQKQPSYACLFYNSNIVQGKDSSMDIC